MSAETRRAVILRCRGDEPYRFYYVIVPYCLKPTTASATDRLMIYSYSHLFTAARKK